MAIVYLPIFHLPFLIFLFLPPVAISGHFDASPHSNRCGGKYHTNANCNCFHPFSPLFLSVASVSFCGTEDPITLLHINAVPHRTFLILYGFPSLILCPFRYVLGATVVTSGMPLRRHTIYTTLHRLNSSTGSQLAIAIHNQRW